MYGGSPHQQPPFWEEERTNLFKIISREPVNWHGLEFVSPTARSLVDALLEKKPQDRLNGESVKQHPFFFGLDWDRLEKCPTHIPPPIKPRVCACCNRTSSLSACVFALASYALTQQVTTKQLHAPNNRISVSQLERSVRDHRAVDEFQGMFPDFYRT